MEAEPGMGCDTGGMWHRHDGVVQSTPEVFFNSESNWETEDGGSKRKDKPFPGGLSK